ncbi:MAG: LPS export ABC transporter periplasmic protein LptC [Piscirickettsiaceae bacterium]|nr:LPS export ABC transporter periplasmic protein LptC [Piscirickettsiaceae bacterium]
MNATSNLPFLAKLLLPLLAIATLWLLSGDDENDKKEHLKINRANDYAMTDFTLTIMNELGQPARVIIGDEMAHYPKDDSTEVINPVAYFIGQENDTWVISSNKGQTTGKGGDIFLTGNVIISRENNNEIELRSEELHLDTVHNTAYTDVAVTISSPYGQTNSVGLHATLDDKTINLHSKVKGQYDAPATQ